MASQQFRRIEVLSEPQVGTLTELFTNLWWTPNRSREQVQAMLQESLVVAFEDDQQQLAAFARVISDRTFKALIFDVVVAPVHRTTGLGRIMMDAILQHDALAGVRHFELYCAPDMVPFYRKWGFSDDLGDLTFMRLETGQP